MQGDVHAFYLKLRRNWPDPPAGKIPELNHVRVIAEYYAKLDPSERHLLLAWAKKEESGIGMIPATLSGIPLLGLLFVPMIQQAIKHLPHWFWMSAWAIGAVFFAAGVYVHQRQHAYATLHVQLLERLCAGEQPGPTGR
ncbi:MAG TPA: hypothetical protein VGK74_24295 [Symbiobacteriaceae bacterium]